jgi:hypothetical protein
MQKFNHFVFFKFKAYVQQTFSLHSIHNELILNLPKNIKYTVKFVYKIVAIVDLRS